MSFLNTVTNLVKRNVQLNNSEPNDVMNIGVHGTLNNVNENSVNWKDSLPDLVIPSINNIRTCYRKSSICKGVIEDLVIKSISGFTIEGDNEEAKKFIEGECERWDIHSLMHDVAVNNCVDGIMFHNTVIKDNHIYLRELAFDGENYKIKKIYDETGTEAIGYKQVTQRNKQTNKGWLRKKFDELVNDKEEIEVNFTMDEILVSNFFNYLGKPEGLIHNVLDECFMLDVLLQMMPQVVYKQTNTMFMTIGNKEVRNINLTEDDEKNLVKLVTDYHKKGVISLPYGVGVEMVGDTVLPKIQEYCTYLEHQIFIGLFTPEVVYNSSSSNRSTAVVQLDSDKSGRVLVQEHIQHKLARYCKELFNRALELQGFKKDSVWIEFDADKEEEEEEEDLINVNPTDGTNQENIHNAEGRVNEGD